ncbi:hypothetical protein HGO38_21690 [Rhizobium sp. CG5]|uniref:lipopolysaccharide biosynthesis protein n=1 Tax=Rhizobium sp. CG5 TaxID=2726076 RepID=UPI002033271E|nr:hypothetical protein [Rhizobium sp. CG5]MCM2476093.1 hypothetical protein [Rhizobium sp. CG5]
MSLGQSSIAGRQAAVSGSGTIETLHMDRAGSQPKTKTRSLAANTLIMSLRTVLTMSVSLYSSRIVLAELGAVDYGIYFAVAGVTLVISFLNSALATSTQRFLNVELTGRDHERLRSVFCTSLQIHVAIALLTILVSEIVGLWLLNTYLVIPGVRMDAARVAFHYAVFATALTIIQVPYNATLVAFERFTAYAVFDILHAVLRLSVAWILIAGSGDLLELFAALMFGVTLLVTVAKVVYCVQGFPSCRYRVCRDRALHSSLSGFAGWSILGAAALVLNIQGVGILLNLFFGPLANAAQNIALQVTNATSTLGSNLQITSNPPIVKAHAAGDHERFHALVEQSARYSFLLMLVLTAPIISSVELVLAFWLTSVPDHAGDITRLLLLTALVNSFSFPLMAAAQATGTIRLYQALVSAVMLSAIPLGYLLLTFGAGLLSVFQLLLGLSCLALGVRLVILRRLVGLDIGRFLGAVVLPAAAIGAVSLSSGWAIRIVSSQSQLTEFAGLVATGVVTLVAVYFFGVSAVERRQMRQAIRNRLNVGGRPA